MKEGENDTDEIVGDGDRRGFLRLVGAALLCLVLANLAVIAAGERPSLNRGYWLVHTKWRMLEDLKEPVDWLILGDSSCNQGIKPDVFDQATGGKSLNLCTIGNMLAVDDAWMLDEYLAHHDPPKGVVLAHVYDVWHRAVSGHAGPVLLGKIPLPWGFWQKSEPHVSLTAEDKWLVFASRYLPLYADNESVGNWIREGGLFRSTRFKLDARGYMAVLEPNTEEVDKDTKEHLEFVRKNTFSISDDNRAALDHIVKLADERGFDVYFADSPMHDALARDDKFVAYHGDLGKMIRGYAAKSAHVRWVMPRPMPFPRAVMENSDHLIDSAASIYSRALGNAVATTRRAAH